MPGARRPSGSSGWVREVYLHGHDRPWVFAARRAAPWKARASTWRCSAPARWASCCSATAPSSAGPSKSAAIRRPVCPPRSAPRVSGAVAHGFAARSGCWWRRCSYRACGTRRESPTYNPRSTPEVPMFVTPDRRWPACTPRLGLRPTGAAGPADRHLPAALADPLVAVDRRGRRAGAEEPADSSSASS